MDTCLCDRPIAACGTSVQGRRRCAVGALHACSPLIRRRALHTLTRARLPSSPLHAERSPRHRDQPFREPFSAQRGTMMRWARSCATASFGRPCAGALIHHAVCARPNLSVRLPRFHLPGAFAAICRELGTALSMSDLIVRTNAAARFVEWWTVTSCCAVGHGRVAATAPHARTRLRLGSSRRNAARKPGPSSATLRPSSRLLGRSIRSKAQRPVRSVGACRRI